MKIINLLPREIKLIKQFPEGGYRVLRTWSPCKDPPELDIVERLDETVLEDDLPVRVTRREYSGNFPEPRPGVRYIVSIVAAQGLDREDFIVPCPIRDKSGEVIGCDRFGTLKEDSDARMALD